MSREANSEIWHVIYTKPNFERKFAGILQQKGINVFIAEQKQLKQYSDRKKWVDVILFRSYIFIKAEDFNQHFATIVYTPGFLKVLLHNGKPAIVTQRGIDQIRQLCGQQQHAISIAENTVEIGKPIEIKEGIFKGIKGTIVQKKNSRQLLVRIDGLEQYLLIDYS